MIPPLLTLREASFLLHSPKGEVALSLDLGKSKATVLIEEDSVILGNQALSKSALRKVKGDSVYFVDGNALKQVSLFSEETNFYYKLFPTADWPTITLSSTPMHRHTRTTPKKDTELKIREISPVKGIVLDTCCGLGYTAIMAAQQAEKVLTFDSDPNVHRVAEYNPYSEELFTNKKIQLTQGDIFEEIKAMKSDTFDRIIHDPPTLSYAPKLYSAEFHQQLFRVLKSGGILYHYCPQPQKTKGKLLYPRIQKQLREAGFQEAEYHWQSSGIRAAK